MWGVVEWGVRVRRDGKAAFWRLDRVAGGNRAASLGAARLVRIVETPMRDAWAGYATPAAVGPDPDHWYRLRRFRGFSKNLWVGVELGVDTAITR